MSYPARYFDGRTSAEHHVTVAVTRAGLDISKADGATVHWEFAAVKPADTTRTGGGPLRLETREELPQSLIAGEELLHAIRAVWPQFAEPDTPHRFLTTLAALAAVTLFTVIVAWKVALPAFGRIAADLVPISIEERMGRMTVDSMAPAERRCDGEAPRAIEEIVRKLERAEPSPYKYRVHVTRDDEVNAFAAPAGYIVVYRGLLRKTRSADELAGVMAHEMQHVVQRHGTHAVMRGLGLMAAVSLILGDPSGLAAGAASMLTQLHFQREDEASADRGAMRMLRGARVDPDAMVSMMRKLAEEGGSLPSAVKYLSTHPMPGDRVAEFQRMAREGGAYTPEPVLPGVAWPPPMRCGGAGEVN